MITPECEAGCLALSGGDVRHHPTCPHYAESIYAMYERERDRSEKLYKILHRIIWDGSYSLQEGVSALAEYEASK